MINIITFYYIIIQHFIIVSVRKLTIFDIFQQNSQPYSYLKHNQTILQNLVNLGNGLWSISAIKQNKRFDLMSIKMEQTLLWSGSQSNHITKTFISKSKILKKIIEYADLKQKCLQQHQILIKIQYENKNSVYLVIKSNHNNFDQKVLHSFSGSQRQQFKQRRTRIKELKSVDIIKNTDLLISQQLFHQTYSIVKQVDIIKPFSNCFTNNKMRLFQQITKILQVTKAPHYNQQQFKKQVLQKKMLEIVQELKLQLQTNSKELQNYKLTQFIQKNKQNEYEADFMNIPSERASLKLDCYVNRNITIETFNKNKIMNNFSTFKI